MNISYSQITREKNIILKQTNVSNLKKLRIQLLKNHLVNYESALLVADKKGWPVKFINPESTYSEIKEITKNGFRIHRVTSNAGFSFTSRANKLNPNGGLGLNLTGKELFVGLWDQDYRR